MILIYFFHTVIQNIIVDVINAELRKILEWIRANKLSLNLLKTNYILFSNSLTSLPTDIILDNTPLEQVSHTTFLGVVVDSKLSWKLHVENICKTISRNVGIINRLKSHLPQRSLLMLYSSLILTILKLWTSALGKHVPNIGGKSFITTKESHSYHM